MATVKCAHCKETVYPLEKIVLAEKPFHRGCAKCSHCQGTLTISSFASADGKLFCKPHFMELFKSTGGKYAFTQSNDQSASSTTVVPKAEARIVAEEKLQEKSVTPKKLSKLASFVGGAFKSEDSKAKKEAKASTPAKAQPEPETVKEATKVEAPKPVEASKPAPVQAQPLNQANKLSAFLNSGAAPQTNVTVVAPAAPVSEPVPIVAAPVPISQNTAGMSKLSMFLQQVEGPAVAAAAPTKIAPAPSNKPAAPEVAKERQASVTDLIHKTEAKPAKKEEPKSLATIPKEETKLPTTFTKEEPKLQQHVAIEEPAKPIAVPTPAKVLSAAVETENQAPADNALSKIKERLAMAKATIATASAEVGHEENAKLRTELEKYRTRCAELEAENLTLRARVDLSDSGKEALVQEIARLNAIIISRDAVQQPQTASSSFKLSMTATKVPLAEKTNENEANQVDQQLKHAKKLLSQGKISKAQYDAAVRASVEANRAIMNGN